jgi:hypothetical protein
MSRQADFEPNAVCDSCGAKGAFDFMGDYLCGRCACGDTSIEDDQPADRADKEDGR